MKDGRYLVGELPMFSKRYAKEREGLHTKLFAKVRSLHIELVDTKVESSFDYQPSEVPFAMTKETKQDGGWGPGCLRASASASGKPPIESALRADRID